MNYTIITPTGDRHKSFELCKKYVDRQSIKPTEWIVVDDGQTPLKTELPEYCKYIYRTPSKHDCAHTLPLNLQVAINQITTDYVFIFEDDDWYHPQYVENSLQYLTQYDLVGHDPTIYYHFDLKKYRTLYYKQNISLYCTCFASKLIPLFTEICKTDTTFIDRKMWTHPSVQSKFFYTTDKMYAVGIKGLEGRQGKTSGHRATMYNDQVADTGYTQLKQWIGEEDFNGYKQFIKD